MRQNKHSFDLGARNQNQSPRRRPNALVCDDADADGTAGNDSGCIDRCYGRAGIHEDDNCEIFDDQLCDYALGLFCGCGKLEGYGGGYTTIDAGCYEGPIRYLFCHNNRFSSAKHLETIQQHGSLNTLYLLIRFCDL